MTRTESPTSINTYLRCPKRYYLKYILGLPEKPNIHMIRGKAVHNTIARFHRIAVKDPEDFEKTKHKLLDLFDHYWRRQEDGMRSLDITDETLNALYQESRKMLMGWLQRYSKVTRNGHGKPKTEIRLLSETHGVMGVIDAVCRKDGEVSLIDYKTSKTDDITRETKIQIAIYALLYKENFGVLPDTIVIDFLKPQREVRFKVTGEFFDFAERICREIHEKTASVNEEDYPCTCGGWCQGDFS
jgi:RecB family exonuclease